jgi:hypothetical protein
VSAGRQAGLPAAGSLELTPDGQVVDFSARSGTTRREVVQRGRPRRRPVLVRGHRVDGGGAVDTTARNLKLNLTVTAGQYAGGGVNFDSCVDARAFNSIQFTASISAGSLDGCTWQVQLRRRNQLPTTDTTRSGGTCNATTTTCRAATRRPPSRPRPTTATPSPTRFTAFNNPAARRRDATQIVGLQWQVTRATTAVHGRAAHRQRSGS